MAMIKCPECGKQVSDKAKACPGCGYPIEDDMPSGIVRIKVSPLAIGINGNQKVTIYGNCRTVWEGNTGEVAELYVDQPTEVTVQYHGCFMHYSGLCKGLVDPSRSKKYNVSARQGITSTQLVFQPVDAFYAD